MMVLSVPAQSFDMLYVGILTGGKTHMGCNSDQASPTDLSMRTDT
jgi:hypothetical protein